MDASIEPFPLDNERPAHIVNVGPFWIGRVPVSHRQWREFIGDGGTSGGAVVRPRLGAPH